MIVLIGQGKFFQIRETLLTPGVVSVIGSRDSGTKIFGVDFGLHL